MSTENRISRVMVVGGGVAGVNAAVELADRGYPVTLVEKSAALGGLVARLHRLYPLCSCCKLNDRVAASLQHPNIEVLTESEIEAVSGAAGNFSVTVKARGAATQKSVGAIILALGVEPFDPSAYATYSYIDFPNVVTSVEFEWLQKPAGPYLGSVKRPSDGKAPKRVAWLQCVGSRDVNACDASYCSSVCCMYALKEASNLLDQDSGVKADFYYMDLRTHGKGYEQFAEKAVAKGIRLIRSRVHSVEQVAGTTDLLIRYLPTNGEATRVQEEVYDMVVLSVGLRPSAAQAALAEKLGIQLKPNRYIQTTSLNPVATSVPGIFVCGAGSGPDDVHDSVVQAAAVVAEVGAVVQPERKAEALPPLRDLAQEPPRTGVLFALCPTKGATISSFVESAGAYAAQLPTVAAVKTLDLAQSNPFRALTEFLQAEKLNRLLFASCSPEIHKEAVESALRGAGLNPYVYDIVDLRTLDTNNVTQLQDLLRMSAARLGLLDPPTLTEVPVVKHALVVGGGLTGMVSALKLASQGVPVTLVEKEAELGGHARSVHATWQGESIPAYVDGLIATIKANDRITVLTEAEVTSSQGFLGNFTTTVAMKGKDQTIAHGVAVLATGGHGLKTQEYLYGKNPNVYSWADLSEKLIRDPASLAKAKRGVFIQCVGSREPQHPYCSRACCTFTVRAALDLKAQNPDMELYVLYREMRTYGEREDLYAEARRKGILFIRYELDKKPVVSETPNGLVVSLSDPILQREIQIPADFISLQTAIEPTDNQALGKAFQISLNADGFFTESPAKMKPVDSEIPGVFVAGLALAPKSTEENVAEGLAAASRALTALQKETLLVGGMVATVNPDLCAACLVCVRTCPFQVPEVKPADGAFFLGAAVIDPGRCQGCGMCVSECPAKAISMTLPSDKQITAMTEALFKAADMRAASSPARR